MNALWVTSTSLRTSALSLSRARKFALQQLLDFALTSRPNLTRNPITAVALIFTFECVQQFYSPCCKRLYKVKNALIHLSTEALLALRGKCLSILASVYPWRNFSLLLITSNSTTGTPLKGSYTVTLNSLGLVEGNTATLPSTLLSLPKPREQCPSSVRGIINENYFGDTI